MSGFFSKKKAIDPEQKAMIMHAQKRIAQRKSLYKHIVFYLAVVLVAFILNVLAGIGDEYQFLNKNWFFWLAVGWGIFVVYHILKFFFISPFLDKAWEEAQLERLVAIQKNRIQELTPKAKSIAKQQTNDSTTDGNEV